MENAPGEILTIPGGVAFLPNPLPPEALPLTALLVRTVGETRGALGEYVGELRLLENPDLVIRPLAIREAVLSNQIEGTHTTFAGVLAQQAGELPVDPAERSRQREVINDFEALGEGVKEIEARRPLGAQLVRALHTILLGEQRESSCRLGMYRTTQAYIGKRFSDIGTALARARFVPPSFEHIDALMDNLFSYMRSESSLDPLIDCALLHYQFEAIHPFEDGNGRMGRLIIPLYLMTRNVIDSPYLYLSDFFEKHMDEYVGFMKSIRTRNAWEPWILFFLKAVKSQADESKSRARTLLGLHREYQRRVREGTGSQAALAALDVVVKKVFLTALDVVEYAKCSDPTARTALKELVKLNVLEKLDGSYPQIWYCRELLARLSKD